MFFYLLLSSKCGFSSYSALRDKGAWWRISLMLSQYNVEQIKSPPFPPHTWPPHQRHRQRLFTQPSIWLNFLQASEAAAAGKEKEKPEANFELINNPCRAIPPQLKVIEMPEGSKYSPLKPVSLMHHGGDRNNLISCSRVFFMLDFADCEDILRCRSYFIWMPRWSKPRFKCILVVAAKRVYTVVSQKICEIVSVPQDDVKPLIAPVLRSFVNCVSQILEACFLCEVVSHKSCSVTSVIRFLLAVVAWRNNFAEVQEFGWTWRFVGTSERSTHWFKMLGYLSVLLCVLSKRIR